MPFLLVLAAGAAAFGQPVEPGKPTEPKPPIPVQDPPPKPPDDPAKPQEGPPSPIAAPDVPEFPISKLDLSYSSEHPGLPPLDEVTAAAKVTLGKVEGGYVLAQTGGERITISVAALNASLAGDNPPKFSRGALRDTLLAVVREYNRRGLIGVIVEVNADDLLITEGPDGEIWQDLRAEDNRTELRAAVYAAVVTQMRSVAAGDRIKNDKVNNPAHARLLRGSPVRPEEPGKTREDLLRKDELDDYVLRMNRIPGRRVDVAISGGENPGEVTLDYLVRESNPLLLYGQVSNTGTKETNIWRERLGFQWAQLSDNDDVLSLDYVTAGFTSSHVLNVSYEMPLSQSGRVRARPYISYSQFDASEVGASAENFSGRTFIIGGELIWNIAQHREVFIDLAAGLRYQNILVNNETVLIEGQTGFLIPNIALRMDRTTDESTSAFSIGLEGNIPGLVTDESELNRLGRLNTDESWVLLTFGGEQSWFLEPIFDAENYRQGKSTLAHELAVSLRGQYAFGYRLVPNFEQVAGGLYSVRGYDESITAGDTVVIGTVEYRLHIPRLLGIQEEPGELFGQTFRWAPQQAYTRPDWDLILRAFVDAARTINSDRLPFERDESLLGTGIGLELVYRRNLSIRVDWGVVLEPVTGKAERGDNRFHIVATLLF